MNVLVICFSCLYFDPEYSLFSIHEAKLFSFWKYGNVDIVQKHVVLLRVWVRLSKHAQDSWDFHLKRVKGPIGIEHKNEKNSTSWRMVSFCSICETSQVSVDGILCWRNVRRTEWLYINTVTKVTVYQSLVIQKLCLLSEYLNQGHIKSEIHQLLRQFNLTLVVKILKLYISSFFHHSLIQPTQCL